MEKFADFWQRKSLFSNPGLRGGGAKARFSNQNVRVIESFTVGEYDLVIFSATESNSWEIWLRENQPTIPQCATKYLSLYIKVKIFFFVVIVNL